MKIIKRILSKFNIYKRNMLFQDINSSKQILLDKYLKSKNSVLFGTSSFWEGVDLPEDKLEVLFILKLPFFAYSSICGPPGNSIPSSFAVLSKASPTASSIVVPNLLYLLKH